MFDIKKKEELRMDRDPFDEFRKIEKMFRKMMNGEGMMSSSMINVQRVGDETKIVVSGDVPDEEIERLKRQYPDAEIEIKGQETKRSSPIEVVDEDEFEKEEDSSPPSSDGEEVDPGELALKRFRERKEEEE